MSSLVDRFCPDVHDAPITAATYDPWSGTLATADAQGLLALTRPGENGPGLLLQPGVAIHALALSRKGKLLAWGDENGSVAVHRVDTGEVCFEELRDATGRVRAMRGVAISPNGDRLASIAIDGLLRIWNLDNGKKVAWTDFGGLSVSFDARGSRILCLDAQGQPRVVDLATNQGLPMDRLQMPADRVMFTLDGTHVIASGAGGISLLRVVDGQLVATHAARGGSGILAAVLSPDGKQVAAVSQRSIHVFSTTDLSNIQDQSRRHGAAEPTGAAWWGGTGVMVPGQDGLVHGASRNGAGPVNCVGGFGDYRLAGHRSKAVLWTQNRRVQSLDIGMPCQELHIDRDGGYILARPEEGPVMVFDARNGQKIYDGGPDTLHAPDVAIGGGVMAMMMAHGGVRWVDLSRNKAYQLDWPIGMALSHGGTWLGAITPRGALRILSPVNGQQVVPDPQLAGVPLKHVAFVSKRPDLLVMDQDGVLTHFDLAPSVRDDRPARGRDVLQLHGVVDRLWGITGGQYAAVRLPEGGTSSILFLDLASSQVAAEVNNLHPRAWVDAEYGLILEPARGSAILEREMSGAERRVLRSLSDGEWACFSERGLIDVSEGFSRVIGG